MKINDMLMYMEELKQIDTVKFAIYLLFYYDICCYC